MIESGVSGPNLRDPGQPGDVPRLSLGTAVVAAIARWWWPGVVVAYVLAFVPGGRNDYSSAVSIRYLILGIGVVGAAAFEALAWRSATLQSVLRSAVRHPPVLLAIAFAVLTLVSAAVSTNAAIGLTGALLGGDDGAMAVQLFVAAFVLVYAQRHRDAGLDHRLVLGFLAMGLVSAVWAIAEVLIGRGFVFQSTILPIVVSLAPGLLAGTMLFVIAVALAYRGRLSVAVTAIALLSAFTVGLTMNRTSILVLGMLSVLWWLLERSRPRTIVVGAVLVAVVTGYFAMATVSTGRGDVFRSDALSGNTLETRVTMWRIALDGIAERPWLGWGGADQFMNVWTEVTSRERALDLLRREEGFTEILGVTATEGQLPVLMVRDADGSARPYRLLKLKVHNQVLDVAIMWGVPAAAALLVLVLLVARNAWRGSGLAVGILVYFGFAMLWYVPFAFEGAFWIALAGAQTMARGAMLGPASRTSPVPPSHG